MTWIGHATVLAQFGGLNVLTDPMFFERASPVSFTGPVRSQPPGLALADLPHIDVVLVSHNHYDLLDETSVRALAAQAGGPPLFVVPLGIKPWLAGVGVSSAVELDWRQSHRVATPAGPVDIVLTPVQHRSGRTLADRIHRDLRAQRSLGIHWGTFALTDEALDEPPRELARAARAMGLPEQEFFVVAIGATRRLPRRSAP